MIQLIQLPKLKLSAILEEQFFHLGILYLKSNQILHHRYVLVEITHHIFRMNSLRKMQFLQKRYQSLVRNVRHLLEIFKTCISCTNL